MTNANIESNVPDFIAKTEPYPVIYDIESEALDDLYREVERIRSNNFIDSASNDSITRIESFLNIKGQGSLEQRKNYLISLNQKGNKLSESTIRNIINSISGSDCIVKFFGSDEMNNPAGGNSLLRVQVLSPDSGKDYHYADIIRTLAPLIPGHIKLSVVKYFASWQDIANNFTDWAIVAKMKDWQSIKDYAEPRIGVY
jgi:hypothetical protein